MGKNRIIATIGAPRSGKSTFAGLLDPVEWVTVTFDDLRQTLWPPNRRTYWSVRESINGDKAQSLLHDVKYAAIDSALSYGFNVIVPDTHVKDSYADFLKEIASKHGIEIEWYVLCVDYAILKERNNKSDESLGHKVPDSVLENFYKMVWAEDAWWLKEGKVGLIHTTPEGKTEYYYKGYNNGKTLIKQFQQSAIAI